MRGLANSARVSTLVLLILLNWRLAIFGRSQVPPYQTNDRQTVQIEDLTRRIEGLEERMSLSAEDRGGLHTEVAVLRSEFDEIQWLVRGVTLAVIGQLAAQLLSWRKRFATP